MKYIYPLILGCIAALVTGEILALSGTQATLDAWIFTLTVASHDIGDRMVMIGSTLFDSAPRGSVTTMAYLLGQGLLEEIVKFIAFFVTLRILKPASIYVIILSGVMVGIGFAAVENFIFYEFLSVSEGVITFILRALGHSLFTGIIALLYAFGYFSQLRWIDAGAQRGILAWMIRYGEPGVAIIFTFLGIIGASITHAALDIIIAFGGQGIVVLLMVVGWGMFFIFLRSPGVVRPYGLLLQKFELMKTIRESTQELQEIQQCTSPKYSSTKASHQKGFIKKVLKSGKQFAKT